MCEALKDLMKDEFVKAEEKGREEGRKEGREEGREEGRKEGREKGRKEGREEGRREGRKEGHEEGRREGHEEGHREGREEGRILEAVVIYRDEMHMSDELITKAIMNKFSLSLEDAEAYVM